jgi:hypothetical protein
LGSTEPDLMPIFTRSELEAYAVLHGISGTTDLIDFHKAGNEIILLAERIKADRAISAMEGH